MSEVNTLNFLFGTDAREYFKFLEVNSETGKFKILLQKYRIQKRGRRRSK